MFEEKGSTVLENWPIFLKDFSPFLSSFYYLGEFFELPRDAAGEGGSRLYKPSRGGGGESKCGVIGSRGLWTI